jgi:hypothetical protein
MKIKLTNVECRFDPPTATTDTTFWLEDTVSGSTFEYAYYSGHFYLKSATSSDIAGSWPSEIDIPSLIPEILEQLQDGWLRRELVALI